MAARKDGKQGYKAEKLWREAWHRAVMRIAKKGKSTKRLEVLADKTVEMGLAGDMTAIKEIGDRLDGRPQQPMTDGDGGPVSLTVEIIDPTQ